MSYLYQHAEKYLDKGISVIPVQTDKRPMLSWAQFQNEFIEKITLKTYLDLGGSNVGIAVVCGRVSGNLMVLDIDNKTDEAEAVLYDLLSIADFNEIVENSKLPIVKTQSGGYHILFRVNKPVEGSTKLAMALDKNKKKQTLIETRGEGSYVLAVPTPGYTMANGISPDNIPVITVEEKEVILNHSRSFNTEFEVKEEMQAPSRVNNNWNLRPGDDFNNDTGSLQIVSSLLSENGWVNTSKNLWRRPGKAKGVSATLNYKGSKLFYVFTSSTVFENNKGYTPFSIYTILKHNGNFKESSRELYSQGYGKRELKANKKESESQTIAIEKVEELPLLPKSVFENLPSILTDIIGAFDQEVERNLVLLSTITVLGHAFSNVYGFYDNRKVHPNLFVFIAMPASSGKGIMNWALKLGAKFDEVYGKEYASAKHIYDVSKEMKSKSKENIKEPTRVYFSIPTNVSTAGFLDQVKANQSRGLLFDTEADVISRNKSQKWGDIGSELRQAFHHEKMSMARKTEKERIDIETPRISVLLSGTIKQIVRFIPDEEDGLFSRFLFFFRHEYSKFRSPFSRSSKGNLEEFFGKLSRNIYDLSMRITSDTEFILTESQIHKFDATFNELESKTLETGNENLFPSARRSGIITFRLAMILSILRHQKDETPPKLIECNDNDLETAIQISATLFKHSERILEELYNNNANQASNATSKFLNQLPSSFTRKIALDEGNKMGVGEKTVESYLTELSKSEIIERVSRGNYNKLAG